MFAAYAYIGAYVAWQAALWLVDPARFWPLEVSQIFGVWFYLPLVVLLPAVLATRQRWAAAALGVPLMVFILSYGPLWLPKPARAVAAGDARTLRVMSWNTWRDHDVMGAFEEAVAALEPDVIALQEVNGRILLDVRAVADAYPYQSYAIAGGHDSLMILSRWPIMQEVTDVNWLGCQCLQVVIDWQGQPVHIVNVHVWAPAYDLVSWERFPLVTNFSSVHQNLVVDALLAELETVDLPLVVMGDFNTADGQANYERIVGSGLVDAQRAGGRGLGLTYPAPFSSVAWLPFPLIRIDYIFSTPDFSPRDFRTVVIDGSDHLSVIADMVYTPSAVPLSSVQSSPARDWSGLPLALLAELRKSPSWSKVLAR